MKSIFIILTILLLGCKSHSQKFLTELNTVQEFKLFSSLPLSAKYGNVSSVKVVFSLASEKLYFLNSNNYTYHYQFCQDVLKDESDITQFNELNYSDSPNRKFLVGNLNYYGSLSKYVLELSPSDEMSENQVKKLYQAIKQDFRPLKKLYFLINNDRFEKNKNNLKLNLDIIEASEIYNNLDFQSISCNKSTGRLKLIRKGEVLDNSDHSKEIVVFEETPLTLPNVRGIIVSEFQTPLSHISILGQNRAIPICASKSIWKLDLAKYTNKNIKFTVKIDTFLFEEIDVLEIQKTLKPIEIKKDLSFKTLVDIGVVSKNGSAYIGNKAMNFSVLSVISQKNNFKVPEQGFAIPFYFYDQHLQLSQAQASIDKLLLNKEILNSPQELKQALTAIQKLILTSKVDQKLVKLIRSRLTAEPKYKKFRFRSSTNAEDANGFSGAGLYASKTVDLTNPKKTIEMALVKVWASLWSFEAFMERVYFGIDQKNVCMGILVHRSFPTEAVNGVAITKNIYRKDYIGFVINAQLGDESVVAPKPGIVCDQFVCFPDNNSDFYSESLDVITRSNINNNQLVMTKVEIQNLANQLETIKQYYYKRFNNNQSYSDFGLDLEFKLEEKTRQLYIKQVRFYNQ